MKNKTLFNFLLILFVNFTLESESESQNTELIEKKTKLMACINLSKSRLTRDEVIFFNLELFR
jgi:hypothetical protein